MTDRLFTYGTLCAPEVMETAAGRRFGAIPARLPDHGAYRVRGADYPGLLPRPGSQVEGLLWQGLDGAAFARLDRYEGELYVRRRVRVLTERGARIAWTYLVRPARRGQLSEEPWDYAEFRERRLARLLERPRGD